MTGETYPSMLKACDAKTHAVANAELRRSQRQKRVNQLIREKVEPAINDAVAKGQLFLTMTVGHEAIGVLDDVYQTLIEGGYDIYEDVENPSDKFGNEYFGISWKDACEGRMGNVFRSDSE